MKAGKKNAKVIRRKLLLNLGTTPFSYCYRCCSCRYLGRYCCCPLLLLLLLLPLEAAVAV